MLTLNKQIQSVAGNILGVIKGRISIPERLEHPEYIKVRAGDIKTKGSNFIIEKCPQFLTATALVKNPELDIKDTCYYAFAREQSYYMSDRPEGKIDPLRGCRTFLNLFDSIKKQGYRPDIYGHIEVLIGYDGTIKLYEGHHRLVILRALNPDQEIEVRVVSRAAAWLRFKQFVFETCQNRMQTYHRIMHPDFANWSVHYDENRRWDKIRAVVGDFHRKRIVDIGVQMGYFSFKMAKEGAEVTGIDNQARWTDLCEQLNMVHGTGIVFHCDDFVNVLCHYQNQKWDYGLFLNVLHWFIIQKNGDEEVIRRSMELLSRRVDRLFFSTGTYAESGCTELPFHKKVPYDKIPQWICQNTEYNNYEYLLSDQEGRKMYLFSR